jgi:hypothetical protein
MSVAVTVRGDGTFMFNTFIFKKLKTDVGLKRATKDMPKGNLFLKSDRGWMKSEFFNQWYEKLHDKLFTVPRPAFLYPSFLHRHVIIVVDNCPSHIISNLPALKYSN